jgi:osmoprotectant transport system permease protein
MDILTTTLHWLIQPDHWLGDTGILLRLREHLWYVLVSMAIASVIALPLWVALAIGAKGLSWLSTCSTLAGRSRLLA